MDSVEAAGRWAAALRRTWPERDVEAFLALYSEQAVFQPPFRSAESAHEHMRWAFALGDVAPEVWVGQPLTANGWAAVEWWAIFHDSDGATTFAATDWLRFDEHGLVTEEIAYWNSTSERIEPRPNWGRIIEGP